MKKQILAILGIALLAFFLVSIVFTQERKKWRKFVDKGNIREYSLTEETEIEKSIFRTYFGPKTKKSPGAVRIAYYSGEVGYSAKVVFYDQNFDVIKEVLVSSCKGSKNGKYVIGEFIIPIEGDLRALGKYKLYDNLGNLYWEMEDTLCYDCTSDYFFVADKGNAVEVDIGYQGLRFYNKDGKEIGRKRIFQGMGWGEEQKIIWGDFSADGNYFAVNASDGRDNSFPGGAAIILFDRNGNEIWRFNVDANEASSIYVSGTGRYIIGANCNILYGDEYIGGMDFKDRRTYLFEKEGKLIRKYDGMSAKLFNGAVFSSSEDYAVIIDRAEKLSLIETSTGDILFQYSLVGRGRGIYFADIAEEGRLVGLISADRIERTNPEIVIIGFDGVKVWSQKFPEIKEPPEQRGPELSLSDDGKRLTAVVGQKIVKFTLVR